MIYSITGIIKEKEDGILIIENNGIAYLLNVSNQTLSHSPSVGEEAMFYTFLNVRDDGLDLFGFSEKKELEFFKMLTTVSGVGARSAIAILSGVTVSSLTTAIISGDYKILTAAKGIGQKTAKRIILELKDKVAKEFEDDFENSLQTGSTDTLAYDNINEAVQALSSLGYTYNDAKKALLNANPNDSVEQLIKIALKNLG
ncbi:MAG: Holliday junction branch migration protein RuvA [Clostridia bacterium]|nr:Holliday junction branch migration protein RuvA [Clostridia bacterium]